jgi:ABC-type bacteriocin/lantibiotic exporter with double-glycine peptidase domain
MPAMTRLTTALLLAALAVSIAPSAPVRPVAHSIERVPFVKQEPKWCGPAALEIVLRFYGLDISQRDIAQEIALPNGEVLNLDLKLFARRKGFRAESHRGDIDLLKTWIARDAPVICQLRLGGIGMRRNHFVVVFGYDDRTSRLIAHTGERASQELKLTDFARAWRGAGNWMLVIRRPQSGEADAKQAAPGVSTASGNSEPQSGSASPSSPSAK